MKLFVGKHRINIKKELVNEKEINVNKCEFEFDEDMELTNDYVKEALFTLNGKTYKQIIGNNECDIPYEVLEKQGDIEIGVVVYKVIDENTYEKLYNPSPVYLHTLIGSLKDAVNSKPITPSEMEQYMQILEDGLQEVENVNIRQEVIQDGTNIYVTDRDGITSVTTILNGQDGQDGVDGKDGIDGKNGVGLQYNWNGTSLGVKREDDISYEYVNLEGKQGSQGPAGENGKDGKDGQDGQDGHTPIKGVDYFTAQDIASLNIPDELADLRDDNTHRTVTDTEKTTWNNKLDSNNIKTINNSSLVGNGNITTLEYIGSAEEHYSSENAFDLNSLEQGYYLIGITGEYSSPMFKATYNSNTYSEGPFMSSTLVYDLALLKITRKVPETVSEDTTIGNLIFFSLDDSGDISYVQSNIVLTTTGLSFQVVLIRDYGIVTIENAQTINGVKTFNYLPESSVTPSSNNQLVNKKYVDDSISSTIGTALTSSY